MTGSGIVLAARQLVELLAAVSSYPDDDSAAQGAAERAAQAFEAEVAAVVVAGALWASVGYPRGQAPTGDLVGATPDRRPVLDVPGVGPCPSLVVPMGNQAGHLLVARAGPDAFTTEDRHLLRGMAQIFHLSMQMRQALNTERAARRDLEHQVARNETLLDELRHNQELLEQSLTDLRQHQRVLEQLLIVQKAITQRQPLIQVLEVITRAAADLLGAGSVGLWLLDPADRNRILLSAHLGLDPADVDALRRLPIRPDDPVGAAILTEEVASGSHPLLFDEAGTPVHALAVPVHDRGVVAGAIMVADVGPEGRVDAGVLTAFAQHVSMALTDDRTLNEVHLAQHDALTGLANRALFLERFAAELARAEDLDGDLAVCFVDLDRFKWVNDALGHDAGDRMLTEVADRIRSGLRPDDLLGRLGGDEFGIVLRDTTQDEALEIAARVQAAVAEPLTLAGRVLRPGASIGVTVRPHRPTDVASLLKAADEQMYQVKRRRRSAPDEGPQAGGTSPTVLERAG